MIEDKPDCYALFSSSYKQYLILDFWCDGDFRIQVTTDVNQSSRFTWEAACVLLQEGIDSDAEFLPADDLQAIYIPRHSSAQLPLFAQAVNP